ncbi:hypothetical protein ENSA5_15940 [Enhygromyxa salina]|uniref:Sporulation protein YtfJ n=1 Tax=Enhygromyxa salina TaxID=215803 RepID=A0A2S9YEB7_9BACT|nr:hypothetical protein [Enhygromyxa salina]PRQ03433.1 hypothetical protein ENSA5_15940 [Enhygromyxa salina]
MDFEAIASQIAQTVQQEANINAIFGEPKKLDEHTIMPVARIKITFGAGGAERPGVMAPAVKVKKETNGNGAPTSSKLGAVGGGGGLEIEVLPLGFVRDGTEGAEFVTIDPTPDNLLGKVEHLIRGIRGPGPKIAEHSA